jgi:hypothetical protein
MNPEQIAISQALLNVANQIATLTANPTPTVSLNGKTVSWDEHYNALVASQQKLREQLQKAGGPFTATRVVR